LETTAIDLYLQDRLDTVSEPPSPNEKIVKAVPNPAGIVELPAWLTIEKETKHLNSEEPIIKKNSRPNKTGLYRSKQRREQRARIKLREDYNEMEQFTFGVAKYSLDVDSLHKKMEDALTEKDREYQMLTGHELWQEKDPGNPNQFKDLKAYIRHLRRTAEQMALKHYKHRGSLVDEVEEKFNELIHQANWLRLMLEDKPATDSFLHSDVQIKDEHGWKKQYIRLKKFSQKEAMLLFGDKDAVKAALGEQDHGRGDIEIIRNITSCSILWDDSKGKENNTLLIETASGISYEIRLHLPKLFAKSKLHANFDWVTRYWVLLIEKFRKFYTKYGGRF